MSRERTAAGAPGIPLGVVLAAVFLVQAAVFGAALLLKPSSLEPVRAGIGPG